jgi:hypothetical protein
MVKLYEFQVHRPDFDNPGSKSANSEGRKKDVDENLRKDVMGFILDHDDLHKKHFLPVAWKLHKEHKSKKYDKEQVHENYMDMVNEGCMEYYKDKKMKKDPNEIFPFEMRLTLAKQLAEIHHDPIAEGIFEGQQSAKKGR